MGDLLVHHAGRHLRDPRAARRAVSGHRAARRQPLCDVSGRVRAGRRGIGHRRDRARDERRARPAVHVGDEQRRPGVAVAHVQAGRERRSRGRRRAEPPENRRGAAARARAARRHLDREGGRQRADHRVAHVGGRTVIGRGARRIRVGERVAGAAARRGRRQGAVLGRRVCDADLAGPREDGGARPDGVRYRVGRARAQRARDDRRRRPQRGARQRADRGDRARRRAARRPTRSARSRCARAPTARRCTCATSRESSSAATITTTRRS